MQSQQTQKSSQPVKSFWSSKLGHASLASIAAMSAMVIMSTQVSADPMSSAMGSAGLIQIQAETPGLIEIA